MPKKLSTSTKASSRYNNDCSAKGIVSNFIKSEKMLLLGSVLSIQRMIIH